jgi:hypothetical protein
MMIYKTIFFLPFLLFGNFVKSQVLISINSKKKIDTLTFQINQFEKIILLVDANNRVSRICNIKYDKLDGFQYYLNEYFLDSLVKFSNDLPTKEKYINLNTGVLNEIYKPNGELSLAYNTNLSIRNKPTTPFGIKEAGFPSLFQYDSMGNLYNIGEIDSNYNYNGESLDLDSERRIVQVRSYVNNISVILLNRLRSIQIRDLNFTGEKYDLIINNDFNNFRTVSEIQIYKNRSNELNNFNLIQTIKVRKNGKVKGVKPNSKLVF